MKKTVLILSLLAFLLGGWVAALWLLPSAVYKGDCQEIRYGVNEGLELVEQDNGAKGKRYVVEDADGNELFTIPLRGCLLDTRFRNGQLRFREQNSKREGFIDRQGMVVFTEDNKNAVPEANRQQAQMLMNGETEEGTKSAADYQPEEQASRQANAPKAGKTSHLSQVNLKTMAQSNPFYKEASKIMQGKLTETDARRRHTILNYCEHFRRAYTTKDLDFLKQVFSDKALIIVGNVIKPVANDNKCQAEAKVTYAIHSKKDYISRLAKVFTANQKIDLKFSGFRIMRHPTMDGIYGVTLRQQYKSDRYADDGYLFLLWDFRNPSMPLALYTLATLSLHEDGPSYGLFFALMRRHGFFIHASSNLKSIGSTEGTCNKEGFTPGSSIKPYYTGNTRHQNYTFTAGAIHHITHGFCLFEGVGYGKAATAWQQTESSGGGYLLNEDFTDKGFAAQLGVLASFNRVSIAASAITIAGKQWQGSIGIGIKIGKQKK